MDISTIKKLMIGLPEDPNFALIAYRDRLIDYYFEGDEQADDRRKWWLFCAHIQEFMETYDTDFTLDFELPKHSRTQN